MKGEKGASDFAAKLIAIGLNVEKAKTLASRAKIRQYPAQASGRTTILCNPH